MATCLYSPAGDIALLGGYQELREKELLASARRGQTAAFGDFCQPNAKKILRTTYRITRNHQDAEEALADSFLRAFAHIKNFDSRPPYAKFRA
jgi:DNA-directed RNA polymerase specialized sigma24 family protein